MIREALEYLLSERRPATAQTAERKFIWNQNRGTYEEVREPLEKTIRFHDHGGHALQLGTISALCELIKDSYAHFKDLPSTGDDDQPFPCRIVVNRSGAVAVFYLNYTSETEDFIEEAECVKVPFNSPTTYMAHDYQQFTDFLDDHTGKIDVEDDIRKALASLKIISKEEVKFEDLGAVTVVTSKVGKDIEDRKIVIPKRVNILMPIATREFQEEVTYLLRINLNGPVFTLTLVSDEAWWDKLIPMIVEDIKARLEGINAYVYEGA